MRPPAKLVVSGEQRHPGGEFFWNAAGVSTLLGQVVRPLVVFAAITPVFSPDFLQVFRSVNSFAHFFPADGETENQLPCCST